MTRSSSSLTVLLLVVVALGCSCNIGANAFAPGRNKSTGSSGNSNGSMVGGSGVGTTSSSSTSSGAITTTALLNTYLIQVEEMSRNRELGDLSPFGSTTTVAIAPNEHRNGKAAVAVSINDNSIRNNTEVNGVMKGAVKGNSNQNKITWITYE